MKRFLNNYTRLMRKKFELVLIIAFSLILLGSYNYIENDEHHVESRIENKSAKVIENKIKYHSNYYWMLNNNVIQYSCYIIANKTNGDESYQQSIYKFKVEVYIEIYLKR